MVSEININFHTAN